MVARRVWRSAAVAGVAGLALVAGLVQPAVAADAGVRSDDTGGSTSVSPDSVAPLSSSGAAASPSAGNPVGAAVSAVQPAGALPPTRSTSLTGFDAARSVLVASGESTQTYKNPDGTYTTQVSATPQRVQNAAGAWVAAGTAVDAVTGGGGQVANNPLSPRFAARGDAAGLLQVSRHGVSASIGLIGAKSVALARRGSTATYAGVLPGANLTYQVSSGSVKEAVVLTAAPTTAPVYRWRITGTGFTPTVGADGEIDLVSTADGSTALTIPPAVMVDSSGVAGVREPAEVNAPMSLSQDAAGWVLSVSPSSAWLSDPARVYPVSVDPTLSAPSWVHSYKSDGTRYDDQYARIGNPNDSGTSLWRSVFHFDYSGFVNTQVTSAAMTVTLVTGTANGYVASTGWAKASAFDCQGGTSAASVVASTGTLGGDEFTAQYATWATQGGTDASSHLSGYEVANLYTYKKVSLSLSVTTTGLPSASTFTPTADALSGLTPRLTGSFSDPVGVGAQYRFSVGTASAGSSPSGLVWDSGWTTQSAVQVPAATLSAGTTYYWQTSIQDSYTVALDSGRVYSSGVSSFTTVNPNPVLQTSATADGVAAAAGATVATVVDTGPLFAWSAVAPDSSGAAPRYDLLIASGSDPTSGVIYTSGWTAGASWQVPDGTLRDGGTYSWTVLTGDVVNATTGEVGAGTVPWSAQLVVNRRLGTSVPSPTQAVGPVTVNLATGNVALSFASPQVGVTGGSMGLSFAYNSQASTIKGLTGRYYDAGTDPTSFAFTGSPLLTRVDPSLSFNWSMGSPAPSVPADDFAVRWSGFISVPTAGSYTFGAVRDNGARVTVAGTKVVDQWTDDAPAGVQPGGTSVSLAANTWVPIQVDYFEHVGAAVFQLQECAGSTAVCTATAGTWATVPSDALSPSVETLPAGWSTTTTLSGDGGDWVQAAADATGIVLTDSTGTAHSWAKTSTGGYTPPAGEQGTLALAGDGTITYTDEAGTVYVFAGNGKLSSITPVQDAKTKATPQLTYRAGTGQLDTVTDPVSGKKIVFTYAGDTTSSGAHVCADKAGFASFASVSGNLLCQITYPAADSSTAAPVTSLYYQATDATNTSFLLSRISDPGSEQTDLGYANGLLTTVRTPLLDDWLAADTSRVAGAANQYTIAYTPTPTAAGVWRAQTVTTPAPDGVTKANQITTTIAYPSVGTTTVARTGIGGTARTVTYDALLRQIADTSPSGLSSTKTWVAGKDLVQTSTDGAGREATTLYDWQDRVTDTYGPAPTSCFGSDLRPVASCAVTPAHTSTTYDGGLSGLAVSYYGNGSWAGVPVGFADDTSALARSWASGSGGWPTSGISADTWSSRATGTITFPAAGTYTLTASNVDDQVTVWVNDAQVINAGLGTTVSGTVTRTTAGPARIRIDYSNSGGMYGSYTLAWSGPSVSAGTVPASALSPNYGLVTSTTSSDSSAAQAPTSTTTTGYGASPWLGHPVTVTKDSGGLNLTTSTAYETDGTANQYNRVTGTWLPAATAAGTLTAATGTTDTYYGATDTQWSSTCTVPAGASAVGLLKSKTDPTPATGTAVTTQYVYDQWGRVVGTKRSGDTSWTCTTYDARGRVTAVAYPAGVSTPSRVVTRHYSGTTATVVDPSVTGSPNGGTITSVSDLLGRVVSYTDVWGIVTSTGYDSAGRVSTTSTTDGTSTYASGVAYDLDSRVKTVSDGGRTVATVTYTGPDLTGVSYPAGGSTTAGNGTGLTRAVDPTGATASVAWAFSSGNGLADAVTRSQSGRVLTDKVTDGSAVSTSGYTYDGAGRLTKATIPGHALTYAYAAAGGCGTNTTAGADSDRTGFTDVPGVGAATSTVYCYDWADRLTATTVTNPVSGANPVDGTSLTAAGTSATLVYDGDGNTTTLADEVNVFDSAARHMSTTTTSGTYERYLRDGEDRVVQRDAHAVNTTSARLGYTGPGDSSDLMLSTADKIVQRELVLPGGVIESLPVGGSATWSYPNVHGDVVAIAGTAGTRTGTYRYDPFGQPVDTSGAIGTTTADDNVADNLPNNSDYSWVGTDQRLYEHTGTLAFIEMGARVYIPALGRFLTTDPVPGGNDNTYTYPCDPTNQYDVDGRKTKGPRHGRSWRPAKISLSGVRNWWNTHTIGVCANYSATYGTFFSGSSCAVHSGREWGAYTSRGGGVGLPVGIGGSFSLMYSNARQLSDLGGDFGDVGGSAGDGAVFGGSYQWGNGIWVGSVSVGIGGDSIAEGHFGDSTTTRTYRWS